MGGGFARCTSSFPFRNQATRFGVRPVTPDRTPKLSLGQFALAFWA